MTAVIPPIYQMHCPRCNRPYKSTVSLGDALEIVKKHIAGQHPDHDPNWHETYPEALGSTPT